MTHLCEAVIIQRTGRSGNGRKSARPRETRRTTNPACGCASTLEPRRTSNTLSDTRLTSRGSPRSRGSSVRVVTQYVLSKNHESRSNMLVQTKGRRDGGARGVNEGTTHRCSRALRPSTRRPPDLRGGTQRRPPLPVTPRVPTGSGCGYRPRAERRAPCEEGGT